MSESRKAFESHVNQYDTFGDEWQDKGVDEHFIAGYEAGKAARAGQESEPFAFCFTDVNGKPSEFCDHPKHAAEGDTRIRTPLYTHPASADVPNEHGKNRFGLDMAYFRNLFNRELNRPLTDFRPDELARVLARAARTADREVLGEAEFRTDAGIPVSGLGQRKAAQVGTTIGVLAQNKEGRVCAVTDLGLCTLLRQGVTGAGDGGQHIDDIAVDRFAEAMKQKLAKQRQKGYGGWNDKELCPDGRLQKYLGACLGKGDPVDIGNFAMMIWNRGESVTDAGVPDADYIRALQDAFDIIQADANTEENYGSMCRIGSVLGKLKDTPTKTDDWIKCSERLPDVLDVWIKMTDGSVVACWSKLDGDFYWNGGGSESYILENTVTHWKPRQQEPGQ